MEALGFCYRESVNQLQAAAFADLGGTDWARPEAGADVQTFVMRFAVLFRAENLDFLLWGLSGHALRRAVFFAQDRPGDGLQSEPFGPDELACAFFAFGDFARLWV